MRYIGFGMNFRFRQAICNEAYKDWDFKDKRDSFRENGQFHLTRFLGGRGGGRVAKRVQDLYRAWPPPNTWNPAALEQRSQRMVALADQIWDFL